MDIFRIGYDSWFLVRFYVLLMGVFLFGILRPCRRSEWRSAGMAQGWVIALYAEMNRRYQATSGMFWPRIRM
jgi:hypothetical protein